MAGKNVFANESDVYVKNGSTEFQVMSSTGALYHQGVQLPNTTLLNVLSVVTWPSTVANTLVDTTTTQALTNKTINNITITDPGTAATLTITSGGTLEAIGAFQHKFTSTANSAVTLPGATDGVLMWTTELDGKITAKTSQINPLSVVTWPTTAAQTLVNTTDAQTLTNKTLGAGVASPIETLAWSSDGVAPSSMVAYGVSRISMTGTDPSTSPVTVTLGAPITGVQKTIIAETTVAYVNTIDINLGAGVGISGTTNQYVAISTLATDYQTINLLGVSTAMWAVLSVNSTVGPWNAATGIRAANAVRTS